MMTPTMFNKIFKAAYNLTYALEIFIFHIIKNVKIKMSPGKYRVKYAPGYAVMQDSFPQTTL